MAARLNDRLSSLMFFLTMLSVIAFISLVFFVPHLEQLWKDGHHGLSAMQVSLIHASRASNNGRLAITLASLLCASIVWRVLAAKHLRQSAA